MHRPATCSPNCAPHHRAALTLRYLDGLPVGEVATMLGRTVHATESLLIRAKAAYRNLPPTDRPHRWAGDVMTDPFDVLRVTDAPLDPRPRVRRRAAGTPSPPNWRTR